MPNELNRYSLSFSLGFALLRIMYCKPSQCHWGRKRREPTYYSLNQEIVNELGVSATWTMLISSADTYNLGGLIKCSNTDIQLNSLWWSCNSSDTIEEISDKLSAMNRSQSHLKAPRYPPRKISNQRRWWEPLRPVSEVLDGFCGQPHTSRLMEVWTNLEHVECDGLMFWLVHDQGARYEWGITYRDILIMPPWRPRWSRPIPPYQLVFPWEVDLYNPEG